MNLSANSNENINEQLKTRTQLIWFKQSEPITEIPQGEYSCKK